MKRSLLLTGIALGVAAIFTAWAIPSKADKIQTHLDRVREIAFFQKSYEIASSFPSYKNRKVYETFGIYKLAKQYKDLELKRQKLDDMLNGQLKDEARDLGMDDKTYEQELQVIKADAEIEAVEAFRQSDDPSTVVAQLDEAYKTLFN